MSDYGNPMFNMGIGSLITEQEIQKHKNKLNELINKLINTHNIDEETTNINEIKNQAEFLSSLLNIKRNELNQHNNMNNNIDNNFFNPMFNQNNMGINNNNDMMNNIPMKQPQMAHQQMMEAPDANHPLMQDILNAPMINNESSINNQMIPQNNASWNLIFKYPNHPQSINIAINPNKPGSIKRYKNISNRIGSWFFCCSYSNN